MNILTLWQHWKGAWEKPKGYKTNWFRMAKHAVLAIHTCCLVGLQGVVAGSQIVQIDSDLTSNAEELTSLVKRLSVMVIVALIKNKGQAK